MHTHRGRVTSRRNFVVGAIAGLKAVVIAAVLFAVPSSAPAQKDAAAPGTAAPATPTALPPGYVGADTCNACHEDASQRFSHTRMGRRFLHQPRSQAERLGCESCHGPGQAHVDAGGGSPGKRNLITFGKKDPTPVEQRNEVCLTCHSTGDRVFWANSAHDARNVPCTGCHRVMENVSPRHQLVRPTELETCGTCHVQKRAAQLRSAHMPVREGKMTCTSCHIPHGSLTQALLKENSPNDNCYRCHAEKRGPFLWQHAPVIESCMNCHDPHGSNHERMLTVAKPRLCQQCHVETQHPTSPYGRDSASLKFVLGRACVNCHINIHGSNHPSGFAFTR